MTPNTIATRFRIKTSVYADGKSRVEVLESTLSEEDPFYKSVIARQEELVRTMDNGSHLETTFEGMAW